MLSIFACLHFTLTHYIAVLQKPCQGNFEKFQGSGESRFGSSGKDRCFSKIPKWQHKLVRNCKRGNLVSYFLNNAAKTCLYGLKISENIEIEHVFQSNAFFHLSSNLHTSCFSAFKGNECIRTGNVDSLFILLIISVITAEYFVQGCITIAIVYLKVYHCFLFILLYKC